MMSVCALRTLRTKTMRPRAPLSVPAWAAPISRRAMSTDLSDAQWEAQFSQAIEAANISADMDYDTSADTLRTLIKTRLLKYSDLHNNPRRFFKAHRILASHATRVGPGFWIRFTVQMNLFGGTILGLASDSQLPLLESLEEKGHLGCFGLTEAFAGVNSGFLVNTRADWDSSERKFILSTPDEGAHKNWISQGYTADKALVLASLYLHGNNLGPHAFVIDLREKGKLVDGVVLTDMGRKTVGNDLDNARIEFRNVAVSHKALLTKFCEFNPDSGEYSVTKGVKPFTMIGQRLFTGRVAVAQAALAFRASLFARTKAYSDNKPIWGPPHKDGTPRTDMRLSHIPQLVAIYKEGEEQGKELEDFVAACESELCDTLVAGRLPSDELIGAIAVAKVKAVESSIALSLKLKQEVGSFALMAGSGFEQLDFLQCCKFAEGDSRILMLKMARDRLRLFQKNQQGAPDEDELCRHITQNIATEMKASGNEQKAWDDNYKEAYELAGMVMDRIFASYQAKA